MANEQLRAYWAELEKTRGLPPGYLERTRQIESGGGKNLYSPTGPVGPFQFTRKTATAMGLPLNQRLDEHASARAAADYAAQNKSILSKALGRDPEAHELYLGHQQGGPGARKLLTAAPDAKGGDVTNPMHLSVNAGDPNAPASSFIDKWRAKWQGPNAKTTIAGSSTPLPSTLTPGPAVAPSLASGMAPTPAPQPALAAAPAAPGPDQAGPIIGRGQGLLGLAQSPEGITGAGLRNFMGGGEMKSAMGGMAQLAGAMAPPPQPPPRPLEIQAEDAHIPDIGSLIDRIKKRKGY